MAATHNIEEKINISFVDASHVLQHDYFSIGPMRFVEKVFFESFLLFSSRKNIRIVIFRENTLAIVV